MLQNNFGLNEKELLILKKLDSFSKIQDFINNIPINFEKDGKDTCLSPRRVLRENRAHCIEGALLAALAIRLNGLGESLVVDMRASQGDYDHVIAVFKQNGKWGAITKTNHAVLRYREPIYDSVHELIMSYFHEYTNEKGNKTLREFSEPINLAIFDNTDWVTSEDNLWFIHDYIDRVKHYKILSEKQEKNLRKADLLEIQSGKLTEWKK